MNNFTTRSVSLAAASILCLALAACSSDEDEQAKHEAEACAATSELRTTIESARTNLTAESTVEEWREARNTIRDHAEKAEQSLEKVAEDSAEDLEDAWKEFTDAVDAIDDDATVQQAGTTLVEEIQALQDARADAVSGLDCN